MTELEKIIRMPRKRVSLTFTITEPGFSSSNSVNNGEYYVDLDTETMLFTAGFYDYGQEKSTWSKKGIESYRDAKCLCERHLAENAEGEESMKKETPSWVDSIYEKDGKTTVLEMKESREPYIMVTESVEATIKQILASLPERDRAIITMRYGLEDGVPKKLNEVAEVFGITKEEIIRIEAMALRKLRHPEGEIEWLK